MHGPVEKNGAGVIGDGDFRIQGLGVQSFGGLGCRLYSPVVKDCANLVGDNAMALLVPK